MIKTCAKLDPNQYQQFETLAQACRAHDHGQPLFYDHLLRQMRNPDSNLLLLQEKQLLGFASVYYFYDDACEIGLMIHPEHRKKGYAYQLLKASLPQLQNKKMETLIFTIGANSPSASFLKHLGLKYQTSEYHMRRSGYDPRFTGTQRISIRSAMEYDIPILCQIDTQCFHVRPEMSERFGRLIHESNYHILVAQYNHQVIGKAHIQWSSENEATLSDIAILPLHQNKGYGGELLEASIQYSLQSGRSQQRLDVETSNASALNLYKRYGFESYDSHDYWDIERTELEKRLTQWG